MLVPFRADLHIHSRYSRATSTKLTVHNLAAWAAIKGIHVLGTGDITHPGWRQELHEHLVLDEMSGLYALRAPQDIASALPQFSFSSSTTSPVRFMLQGEISSIYKRGGKVRRVHNLVFLPTLEAAEKLCTRLAAIGNLEADGRPILGLDSHTLLDIVLETAPGAFLVPAHIWTPWFSIFGSKSGFDTIEECFGDLSSEIFALETGLSSDPYMNRLWSALDNYRLISNSDAHSGENLGREVNIFTGECSYTGIYHALRGTSTSSQFIGTMEFFPEEGKYHLDGHRNCHVVLSPEESKQLGGICPVCGKPLTLGVLYRVQELADRKTPIFSANESYSSLIPLPEVLSEITGTGPKSKKTVNLYARTIETLGSELEILHATSLSDITQFLPPLGEAIDRMRQGKVIRHGGFDGEYGTVKVFSPEEQIELRQGALPSTLLKKKVC